METVPAILNTYGEKNLDHQGQCTCKPLTCLTIRLVSSGLIENVHQHITPMHSHFILCIAHIKVKIRLIRLFKTPLIDFLLNIPKTFFLSELKISSIFTLSKFLSRTASNSEISVTTWSSICRRLVKSPSLFRLLSRIIIANRFPNFAPKKSPMKGICNNAFRLLKRS